MIEAELGTVGSCLKCKTVRTMLGSQKTSTKLYHFDFFVVISSALYGTCKSRFDFHKLEFISQQTTPAEMIIMEMAFKNSIDNLELFLIAGKVIPWLNILVFNYL